MLWKEKHIHVQVQFNFGVLYLKSLDISHLPYQVQECQVWRITNEYSSDLCLWSHSRWSRCSRPRIGLSPGHSPLHHNLPHPQGQNLDLVPVGQNS